MMGETQVIIQKMIKLLLEKVVKQSIDYGMYFFHNYSVILASFLNKKNLQCIVFCFMFILPNLQHTDLK